MTRKYDELTQMFMRLERITEDGGSGRDELFINAFQQIKNFDIENLILGHGFLSFHYYNSYIISSHNDLSEITYSYGIVGLLLLILFYFLVARRFYFLCKNKDSLFLPYAEAFVILLVLGFLASMFFFQYYSVLLFSFFGVMEGYLQKSKR
jgi:O-antigen ligase